MAGMLMPYGSQCAARLVAKVGRPSKAGCTAVSLMPYGSDGNAPVTAKVGSTSKEQAAAAHAKTRRVTRLKPRG